MKVHCPHASRCPGCPLIGESYEAGLESKRARVERAFARYPELSALSLEAPLAAATAVGYRVRAKLVTDNRGRLGLFAAGTHDVVDIPECLVLAPPLALVARTLRRLLPLEVPLSGVDLRLADRGVLVTLICEGDAAPEVVRGIAERIVQQAPSVVGVALSRRRAEDVQMLGQGPKLVLGSAAEPHHFELGAPWHYAAHGAFTQVHPAQAARLHAAIEAALEQGLGGLAGRRVLELYAGSGALGLRLAARGAQVTAVERFEPALRRLGDAARAQALELELRACEAAEFLSQPMATPPRFDAVIVNPPRRGLEPRVREAITRLMPGRLVYVSCEPETLARDLSQFAALGLAASRVLALDMIPLSDAIECVCVLTPTAPPAPRVLFDDNAAIALFKPPFEPVAAEREPSLLARARRALGLAELTPVLPLGREASGVCWFAKSPGGVAPLAAALSQGEQSYLALAHGITHKKGKIERPLAQGGARLSARSRYVRREVLAGHSLLELSLEHERKQQARRHLAAIGHPVVGDERYGQAAANRHFEHRHGLDRPFLHCSAWRLELAGQRVTVEAELAGDLAAVIASLRAASAPPAGAESPRPNG